ncbi:Peptidyl-tRNA hydrolase 2 [Candida viswanathii]|uniref:peptidyl-tRNA hydrolase n=1 Tax=Candida viswanathii TaxID=5486 RepID=A0A367YBD2_9ASCO|nr:Peptidyl-tRNA hydrolase 2 [Candida viswanathii]
MTNQSNFTYSTDSEDEYDDETDEDDGIDVNSTELNSVPGSVARRVGALQEDDDAWVGVVQPGDGARWEYGNGTAKITLLVPNQEEMDLLYARAISLGINAYIVHDAGRTQIAAGSATVLGLGPAPKRVLDEVTGELKLY